jgi:predicted glycogen debranching enzyme
MRRFHGLFVAAHPAPIGRILLLHLLEDEVSLPDGGTHALSALRGRDPAGPDSAFCLQAGLPLWTFSLGDGVAVEKTLMMPHGQNTVHVRYRLLGGPALTLRLRPWLDFRLHEGLLSGRQIHRYSSTPTRPGSCECVRDEFAVTLRMRVNGESSLFSPDVRDWNDIPYAIERDRGYDHSGSMHSPGEFTATLAVDRDVYLSGSTESWTHLDELLPEASWSLELKRRERLLASSDVSLQAPETFLLALAADQFIVRPVTREMDEVQAHAVGVEPRTVIAGYPWFTDWGRDTMISLDGLTLRTGRHVEARDILRTFAFHVRHGLIPNLFPEGQREGLYHTADATLWFFNALHRYDTTTGDRSLVDELLPVLEDIVRCHRDGTSYNIRVDDDGLLMQGEPGKQLTWMDALVDGWVVTPRRGKAVEINALWHNALALLASWLARAGREPVAEGIRLEARRCRDTFNRRFWNPERRQLYDVVDGEEGNDDACRPNQVLAIALPHPALDRLRWEAVLDSVAAALLTPVGLRTLSPRHADYKARYFGDLRARDAAYHQGTVWPWLMGPFVDAWLAVHPDDSDGARALLSPLLEHLTSGGCVGSVSEIFDAESPFTPRGCFAQAWSVAELVRVLVRLGAGRRADTTASLPPEVRPA